jgi:hypothetical protein
LHDWLKSMREGTGPRKRRPLQKPRRLFEQLESREMLSFTHPGGLSTLIDLNRMKTEVAAAAHPWIDDWNKLIADSHAQLTYSDHSTANMGSSRQNADSDAIAAYLDTIRWYVSGDTRYADKAALIYNNWSSKVNVVPSGGDIPGLIGIAIADFAMGAEILRVYSGWTTTNFNAFKSMMTTYMYPVCHDFLTNHNGAAIDAYWSNWDACNIGALISMGVLCDNQSIFDEGVTYFKTGAGMGSIEHAVPYLYPDGLGQQQESGRDQEHAQLAIGLLSSACQVAWNQGVDLFGYDNNRLLAGAEYVARTNLSQPVPYTYYTNSDNANQLYLSINGLGRVDDRPIWEQIYNHYAVLEGLSAPNVKAMASLLRPEPGANGKDHIGYGTLFYTLDAAASPLPPSAIAPVPTNLTATAGIGCVMLNWTSSGTTAQGYKVMRATVSGGPYTTIYSSTNYTLPQYTDKSVSNGITYYYVVAANNQAGTSGNSSQVSAIPQAAGALPANWTRQDLGTVITAGTATYAAVAGNAFIVAGSGSDIGSAADSGQFAYETISGNCTIIARLFSATLSGSGSDKVGIMIRESTASGAKTVAVTLGEAGFRGARLKIRSSTGGSMTSAYGDDYTSLPVWFMLRRVGSTFYGYQSIDGITWYLISSTTVSMSSTALVGLVVCSRSSTGALTTATFDNVTITNNSTLASSVAGRYIFYNNSKFDAVWNDDAIATDKQALLPGQTAAIANYTSYSRGINGIMVDIAGLVNPGALLAGDFLFQTGTGDTWITAPAPSSILAVPGAGTGDSCRVYITWADNAIQNKWLKVTVLADSRTLLPSADVFYFGNAIGESGNSATDAVVDSADETASRTHKTGFSAAAIDNHYDYNRDGKVNATDDLIARNNTSGSNPLQLIAAPAGAPLAAGDTLQPLSAVADIAIAQPAMVETATLPPAALMEDSAKSQTAAVSVENTISVRLFRPVPLLAYPAVPDLAPVSLSSVQTQFPGVLHLRDIAGNAILFGASLDAGVSDQWVPMPERGNQISRLAPSQDRLHDAVFARSARFSLSEEDGQPADSSAPADIETYLNECLPTNSGKSPVRAIDNVFAALRHKKAGR